MCYLLNKLKWITPWCVVIGFLAVAGCSSNLASPIGADTEVSARENSTGLQHSADAGLPALPDSRIAVEVGSEYFTAAETFIEGYGAYEIDPLGGSACLYGLEGELTWAIFGVPAPSPESGFNAFDVDMLLEEGQQAWIAVADYEQGSWYTFPDVFEGGMAYPSIEVYDGWLSPESNNLYFAVICTEGNNICMAGAAAAKVSHDVSINYWKIEYSNAGKKESETLAEDENKADVPAAVTIADVTLLVFKDTKKHEVDFYTWRVKKGKATFTTNPDGDIPQKRNGAAGNTNQLSLKAAKGEEVIIEVKAYCDGDPHKVDTMLLTLSIT